MGKFRICSLAILQLSFFVHCGVGKMLRQNIVDPKSTTEKKAEDRQMQFHIIQSDNRDISYPYVGKGNDHFLYATATNYLYAKLHGYEYKRYQWEIPEQDGKAPNKKYSKVCGDRMAPWCKVVSIYDYMMHTPGSVPGDENWIHYVDGDVTVKDFQESIGKHLNYLSDDGYIAKPQNPSAFLVPNPSPYVVNTGTMIVNNNNIGKLIIEQWWNCEYNPAGVCEPRRSHGHFDNPVFAQEIFPLHQDDIAVFDDKAMWGGDSFWNHIPSFRFAERLPTFVKAFQEGMEIYQQYYSRNDPRKMYGPSKEGKSLEEWTIESLKYVLHHIKTHKTQIMDNSSPVMAELDKMGAEKGAALFPPKIETS